MMPHEGIWRISGEGLFTRECLEEVFSEVRDPHGPEMAQRGAALEPLPSELACRVRPKGQTRLDNFACSVWAA